MSSFEYFLDADTNKSGLYLHALTVLEFLACLVQEKNLI
jgi:hypothetical protein